MSIPVSQFLSSIFKHIVPLLFVIFLSGEVSYLILKLGTLMLRR